MSNLTIALEDDLLKEARIKALKEGTSLNAYLRQCVADYVGRKSAAEGEQLAREFQAFCERVKGDSGGWKFNREEIYDRPVLRR